MTNGEFEHIFPTDGQKAPCGFDPSIYEPVAALQEATDAIPVSCRENCAKARMLAESAIAATENFTELMHNVEHDLDIDPAARQQFMTGLLEGIQKITADAPPEITEAVQAMDADTLTQALGQARDKAIESAREEALEEIQELRETTEFCSGPVRLYGETDRVSCVIDICQSDIKNSVISNEEIVVIGTLDAMFE